jgi:hypothetical protein
MRLRRGDRLRCSNTEFCSRLSVMDQGSVEGTKALLPDAGGSPMRKFSEWPAVTTLGLTGVFTLADGVCGPR